MSKQYAKIHIQILYYTQNALSLSLLHTCTHMHTLTSSLSLSLFHTYMHTLTSSLSLTQTHTHTHFFSLSSYSTFISIPLHAVAKGHLWTPSANFKLKFGSKSLRHVFFILIFYLSYLPDTRGVQIWSAWGGNFLRSPPPLNRCRSRSRMGRGGQSVHFIPFFRDRICQLVTVTTSFASREIFFYQ